MKYLVRHFGMNEKEFRRPMINHRVLSISVCWRFLDHRDTAILVLNILISYQQSNSEVKIKLNGLWVSEKINGIWESHNEFHENRKSITTTCTWNYFTLLLFFYNQCFSTLGHFYTIFSTSIRFRFQGLSKVQFALKRTFVFHLR